MEVLATWVMGDEVGQMVGGQAGYVGVDQGSDGPSWQEVVENVHV